MDRIIQLEKDHVLHTYNRPPFVLTHGEGLTVTDSEGNTYLDFGSGIAVTALGHAHPEIVAAVQGQVAQISHVSNLYHTAPHAELAAALCEGSFADKVYFCNSGAEASEAAIKFARKLAYHSGLRDKTEIVSFTQAFHGRTMGALAVTPREKYQSAFRPMMPGAVIATYNDLNSARAVVGPNTCAVIVEPVQGEGGVTPADPAFLAGLRALCDEFDAVLIFDEVQCGLGRTGHTWAYQGYDVTPDILTTAKALGGGLPMGAALVNDEVAGVIQPGDHASTFAGGPVVAAAAQVVVKYAADPGMLAHINQMSQMLIERLKELNSPHIVEVRGKGLMIGIELDIEAAPLLDKGYEHGVMLLTAGPNVLRLLPAYTLDKEHIDQLMIALASMFAEIE